MSERTMGRHRRNSQSSRTTHRIVRTIRGVSIVGMLMVVVPAIADEPRTAGEPNSATMPSSSPRFTVERARGHVVFLGEAMQRRHGVKWVQEADDRSLALETDDGRLLPLVEDIRGRGLRKDERLRKMHVELLMRQYAGVPVRQVIGVFELTKSDQFEIDYWCEICAIAMYELKECECCQGPIELRRRRVSRP